MISDLTGLLGQVHPVAAYAILSLALLIESNLIVGVFVPTLTLMVTAGVLARSGYLDFPVVVTVAAGSVVTADLISYHTGRYLGQRLLTKRISPAMWRRAESTMGRYGGRAVFPARFVPLLRSVVPHLAGATGVPYRAVAPYGIAAATVWALVEAGAGYAAAHSTSEILKHPATGVVAITLIAAGTVALTVRHRRRRTSRAPEAPARRAPCVPRRSGPVR